MSKKQEELLADLQRIISKMADTSERLTLVLDDLRARLEDLERTAQPARRASLADLVARCSLPEDRASD